MTSASSLEKVVPHSVTVSVRALNIAARWYVEKLGFQEVQRKEYAAFRTSLVFLELNGFRVELIHDGHSNSGAPCPDPPAHTSSFGLSQFALRTADLAAVKRELTTRGVPIVWEFENAELGAKFLFIRDADGNLIQYLQPLGRR